MKETNAIHRIKVSLHACGFFRYPINTDVLMNVLLCPYLIMSMIIKKRCGLCSNIYMYVICISIHVYTCICINGLSGV